MDTSFLLFAANNPIQYSNSILDLKSFQIIILEDVINELIGISKDKGIMRSRNALNALAYTKTLIHQKVDKKITNSSKRFNKRYRSAKDHFVAAVIFF